MAELAEFVAAQDAVWADVVAEIAAGRKRTHWIWYVFPQLRSLGRSGMAQHFGLAGADAAAAYLAHPVLGPRLREVAKLTLDCGERDPVRLFGEIDALKVRSSMTLFEAVPEAPAEFAELLRVMYGGSRCPLTLAELGRA